MSLYETDFYAWTNEQAVLLRAGRLVALDAQNIAEEMESMGKSQKRALASRLAVLLAHMLKWRFQPDRRGASWEATITIQRRALVRHLRDNPSLRACPESLFMIPMASGEPVHRDQGPPPVAALRARGLIRWMAAGAKAKPVGIMDRLSGQALKAGLDEAVEEAYDTAALEARGETGLPMAIFPATCPWPWNQIIDQEFWPD